MAARTIVQHRRSTELTLIVMFCIVFFTAISQEGFGHHFATDPFAAFVDAVYGAATLVQSYLPYA